MSKQEKYQRPEKYNSPLATNLRNLMEERKTNITALAKTLGISRQAFSQYADGTGQPNAEKLALIADYFGVSIDWLLGRSGGVKTINAEVRAVAQYTGLSEKAVEYLHWLAANHPGAVKVSSFGTQEFAVLQLLDELITSEPLIEMFIEVGEYLINGDALSNIVFKQEPVKLSINDILKFRDLLEREGYTVEEKKDVAEMHLQAAADMFKNVFREILNRKIQN